MVLTAYNRIFILSGLVLLMLTGCAHRGGDGNPLPAMTFEHIAPLMVAAGTVRIENRYDPSLYPEDVSGQFFIAPGLVVENFLRTRIRGDRERYDGIFSLIIDEAKVTRRLVPAENRIARWLDVAGYEEYEIVVKLRLLPDPQTHPGRQARSAAFSRTLSISEHMSLAERERSQLKSLEALADDVNKGVSSILKDKLQLVLRDLGSGP